MLRLLCGIIGLLAVTYGHPITEVTVAPSQNLSKAEHCVTSESWQAYAFLVEDCYAAIQQMYIRDVSDICPCKVDMLRSYADEVTCTPYITSRRSVLYQNPED